MSATFALRGIITGHEGAVLSGTTLEILDGANKGQRVVTDSQGHYGFTGLPPGGFTLQASAVDYATATRPVTLTRDSSLDFPLKPLLAQFAVVETITPVSYPDGSFGARFRIANTGDGCAADLSATAYFYDKSQTLVSSPAWPGTSTLLVRPAEQLILEFCCLTREQAAAVASYYMGLKWATVHCT